MVKQTHRPTDNELYEYLCKVAGRDNFKLEQSTSTIVIFYDCSFKSYEKEYHVVGVTRGLIINASETFDLVDMVNAALELELITYD